MTQRILIHVDPLGNVSIDAEGFKGQKCEEVTAVLEASFAGIAGDRQHKPEYYESEGVGQTQEADMNF